MQSNQRGLFLICLGLALCFVVGWAACRYGTHAPPTHRAGLGSAMDELLAAEPGWHFYPASEVTANAGFFATAGARNPDELRRLEFAPGTAAQWRGVLRVTLAPKSDRLDLGSDSQVAGPFLLCGDPEMVARAATLLRGR